MKIKEIKIENFKIYRGEFTFPISHNLVFLVGENNTGKSTLMEAISFLKSGLPASKTLSELKNKYCNDGDHLRITVKFQGDIKEIIGVFSEKKYEKYVYDEDGTETILVQRSSENRTIKQTGKDVELSIKSITLWNPEVNQFENPSGLDTVFKTLFETQFVWADTNPDEIVDFGSTKICGSLLKNAIGDFFDQDKWKEFERVHKETFENGDDCLNKRVEDLENKIKILLLSQYGQANIKFNFSLPDTSTFYKSGNILVDEIPLNQTGSGLQRAIALTIIQIYSDGLVKPNDDEDSVKPLFFFIDEPEICLHPKAQRQLLAALKKISDNQQIFVSTHSPFLLKEYDSKSNDLFVFSKNTNDSIDVKTSISMDLFDWSPSWGEINYYAYGLPTIDFHNELYGYIQEKNNSYTEPQMETFLSSNGIAKTKKWKRVNSGVVQPEYDVTLMTYIRNTIHHPENTENITYTDAEIKESIDKMIVLAKLP